MCDAEVTHEATITFRRINSKTVWDVCQLSETLTPEQRDMIADNGASIAEAHFSENAWFRAIYANDTLIGFIMLHIGPDYDEGINYAGAFLWRFMIATPFQRKGLASKAIKLLISDLQMQGFNELQVSYGQGEGSPEKFYQSLGFLPTGEISGDDEIVAVMKFN